MRRANVYILLYELEKIIGIGKPDRILLDTEDHGAVLEYYFSNPASHSHSAIFAFYDNNEIFYKYRNDEKKIRIYEEGEFDIKELHVFLQKVKEAI